MSEAKDSHQNQPSGSGGTRVALGIAYDGSSWAGWQTQPGGMTIQDCVEDAIERFAGTRLPTICAGRTDAGVHALEQVIHVDAPFSRPSGAWVRALNTYLPDSIAVQWAMPVSNQFHARFSATARQYTYLILNTAHRHPLWSKRAAWCFRPLDADAMNAAVQKLLGEHDFSSFRSSQCQAASPVRTMLAASVVRHGPFIVIRLKANAFLHHMVRNIVGELVYLGQGRTDLDHFVKVLNARDRTVAAPTYCAAGLYLSGVDYPPELLPRPHDENLVERFLNFQVI